MNGMLLILVFGAFAGLGYLLYISGSAGAEERAKAKYRRKYEREPERPPTSAEMSSEARWYAGLGAAMTLLGLFLCGCVLLMAAAEGLGL